MNANCKSIVNTTPRQIISAVCLSVFLFVATAFGQSPLRANGKIAFTSDRDGNREIYVMNPDGSNQTRLTNNSIVDDQASWSPDGTRLAFVSQSQNGNLAIFTMNADGSARTEITPLNLTTSTLMTTLSWSPDGNRIAFHDLVADSNIDIFAVNVDGSGRQNLTANHNDWDLLPVWSPDGSKILFSRYDVYPPTGYAGTMLHTIEPDGTNLTRLLNGFEHGWNEDYADWSPATNKILYINNYWDLSIGLHIANPDGTGRTMIFTAPDMALARFSPDGTKVVFSQFQGPVEIFAANLDGSGLTQLTDTVGSNYAPSWQLLPKATAADFDGDGHADVSVFRPSDRVWYLNQSTNRFFATQFGLSSDKITPADFDNDRKTDISVYRDGVWYWLKSSDNSFNAVQFGLPGDVPVPADYTGDGLAELAIYRSGAWWTLNLENNQTQVVNFGLAADKPVPADYDGDGRTDQAIYRNGEWHINGSSQGYVVLNFGLATDRPVACDYDGDGKADVAVYRNGEWHINRSMLGYTVIRFGLATDIPTPADYDGDGRTDIAVFRDGVWYLLQTTGGFAAQQFGLANDQPVPSAFLP